MKFRSSELTEVVHQADVLKFDRNLNDRMKIYECHAIKWKNGYRPFLNYNKTTKFMLLKGQ